MPELPVLRIGSPLPLVAILEPPELEVPLVPLHRVQYPLGVLLAQPGGGARVGLAELRLGLRLVLALAGAAVRGLVLVRAAARVAALHLPGRLPAAVRLAPVALPAVAPVAARVRAPRVPAAVRAAVRPAVPARVGAAVAPGVRPLPGVVAAGGR